MYQVKTRTSFLGHPTLHFYLAVPLEPSYSEDINCVLFSSSKNINYFQKSFRSTNNQQPTIIQNHRDYYSDRFTLNILNTFNIGNITIYFSVFQRLVTSYWNSECTKLKIKQYNSTYLLFPVTSNSC